MDAAELAAGAKPGGASGARSSESPPADFSGHLADLAQREAQSNGLNGNASDSGCAAPALARLDFDPAAMAAKTTPFGAVISSLDPHEAKPGGLMAPSAAITESRPGSNVLAARADRNSSGGNPPAFRVPDVGRGKPGIELGAGAAKPSAHGLPAGFEKPVRKSNSLGDAHTSTINAAPAAAQPPMSAHASRTAEAPAPDPRQNGNGGLAPLSANETSFSAAVALSGAFSKATRTDLAPAAGGEDGRRGTLASGPPSLDASGSFNRFGMQTLELKKTVPADANWDRDLDIALRVPVRITTAAQETHFPLAKELSPCGQMMTLNQRSSHAGEAGSGVVPGEDLPQAANLDRGAAGPQAGGNHFAKIPVEPAGNLDSLVVPSVRASASAGNERGDVLSATVLSLGGTGPGLSEHSAPASGSMILKTNSPLTAGLAAADSQFPGNELARAPPEPAGVHAAGGISPIRVLPPAVHDQARPVSAKPVSPAIQIANSMLAQADSGGSVRDTGGAQPEPMIQKAEEALPSASRVQILHLQLEPENLGKVTVKMRLAGQKLELQVEAERPETARLIGNDTELLSGKLQSAGYAIDTVAIRTANLQAPQPGPAAGAGANQDQHAGQANGGPAAHDRPSMREENSRSQPISEDDANGVHRIPAADGELYL